MKKSILFMACCIGLLFFASCKKDPIAPSITLMQGEGYLTENAQVFTGDEVTVGFNATGEDLTKLEVTLSANGTIFTSHFESIEKQASYNYSHTFTIDASGTVTISGVVTDASGQTTSKSFNIICNEKPNAKFIGHYEGDVLFSGFIFTPVPGYEQMDFEDQPFPTQVDIVAGDAINEVVATITINDQATSAKGVIDGDRVTFEAINTTYNLTYVVTIPLEMTYNIIGTLNEGMLDIEGDCKGEGEVNIPPFITGPVTLEGTIGGSLVKQ
ncbi:MAG: hypothetical protein IKX35_01775 [Bacteroidales bacterium]|nr:hypothetical protein [Bacteroidales bacterium]